MAGANEKEITGAWIIHHGRKLTLDANGPAEFPAIDESAKAATLLAKLGQTNQVDIPISEVRAIATAAGLNPRHELNGLLPVLERKRLIEQSEDAISVLGITTRATVGHAADLFHEAEPGPYEQASITLAEIASDVPVRRYDVIEQIGDKHRLADNQVKDFLNRAEEIGFVDTEGNGQDRILFNGNLFRRDSVAKSQKVLSTLTESERTRLQELKVELESKGCLYINRVEEILTKNLLEKLVAAGALDLNQVANEQGNHVFVTSPSAFHKFVNPLIDDCFDMAKLLVAALTYGMEARPSHQGRISYLPALLRKLIRGYEVGPATAIGHDYRILEINRVVKLRPDSQY